MCPSLSGEGKFLCLDAVSFAKKRESLRKFMRRLVIIAVDVSREFLLSRASILRYTYVYESTKTSLWNARGTFGWSRLNDLWRMMCIQGKTKLKYTKPMGAKLSRLMHKRIIGWGNSIISEIAWTSDVDFLFVVRKHGRAIEESKWRGLPLPVDSSIKPKGNHPPAQHSRAQLYGQSNVFTSR